MRGRRGDPGCLHGAPGHQGLGRHAGWLLPCLVAALGPACVVSTFEGPSDPSRAPSRPLPVGFDPPEGPPAEALASDVPDDPEAKLSVSHVLIMHRDSDRAIPGVSRTRLQARKLAEKVRLLATSKRVAFPELARQYSDEPGAADRGGRLPPFGRGVMVPAFERAALELEPGEISEVVETGFGFHVILRHE